MTTFVYTILTHHDDIALELAPADPSAVTEPMWAELAAQMVLEPGLLPYPPATLAHRAREGYAAVAISGSHIVSHVAMVPLACRTGRSGAGSSGASHTWADFCARARRSDPAAFGVGEVPSLDVYHCGGSWTAPAWRGKGVSMALHAPLVEHCLADGSLGVSGTSGASSRRLGQLGWQILGWSATPFVSSLLGIPLVGFEDCVAIAWQPPARPARYEGPPLDPSDPAHPWSQFCYFWVSSPAAAIQLERQLAEVCHDDLYRWRRAVLEIFNQPGASHRLALLP